MILPIVAYGDPVLKQKAKPIAADFPDLDTLIQNMFETMYRAHGVGLAAPQIGLSIRLFVVDAEPFDPEKLKGFKKVFINPEIINSTDEKTVFNEGCLSIPEIREDVSRPFGITLRYFDEHFVQHEIHFDDLKARVIQHEYDHLEGVLFIDYLSQLRKTMLSRKLENIKKGAIEVDYKMRFPAKSKKR